MIVEILTQPYSAGVLASAQTFTINHAVKGVSLDNDSNFYDFIGPGLSNKLQPNDNFVLLSIGVNLPYFFGKGERGFWLEIGWKDQHGIQGTFSDLGGSRIHIPYENAEIQMGNLLSWPSGATPGDKIILNANIINPGIAPLFPYLWAQISMIDIPVDFIDGEKYPVPLFMKIAHNLPLVL